MKIAKFILLISLAASYSLNSNAQIAQSCDYSQAVESQLVELAKTSQKPNIDPACAGKMNFFDALSNLEQINSLEPQQRVILAGVALEKIQATGKFGPWKN